jgi:myo-inositol 2-dehydrogenase/D-chiro-inositol 1-dehydrogenase
MTDRLTYSLNIQNPGSLRSLRHPADRRPGFADAYRPELQAWTDALATRSPSPPATAHDGLVAGAVTEAVIASMKNGGGTVAVQVPEV